MVCAFDLNVLFVLQWHLLFSITLVQHIHGCWCQCVFSCILLAESINVYFMSVLCLQLLASVCLRVCECLQIFKDLLFVVASTSDWEKQQQYIPWCVWLGWEPLHPGPLWLIWHLNSTLTKDLDKVAPSVQLNASWPQSFLFSSLLFSKMNTLNWCGRGLGLWVVCQPFIAVVVFVL